jgi:hypothetical protein
MKNIIKASLVALCLGTAVGCAGNQEVKEPEPVSIPLGDYRSVKGMGFIKYNGMTGDNQRFLLSNANHNAVNTFYPVKNTCLNFQGHRLYVNFVTPDSIGLTHLRELSEN